MFGIPRLLSNSGVVDHPNDADVDDDGNIATPGSGLHPDGGIDIGDMLAYNALFEAGDVRADLDNGSRLGVPDSSVDISDLLYFLAKFEQGTRGGDLNDDRFLWRGYRWDPHLAVYHVRNRVFDPKTMHWLQPDPLGEVDGPNPYAYVGWDPFNRIDPLGLWGWDGDWIELGLGGLLGFHGGEVARAGWGEAARMAKRAPGSVARAGAEVVYMVADVAVAVLAPEIYVYDYNPLSSYARSLDRGGTWGEVLGDGARATGQMLVSIASVGTYDIATGVVYYVNSGDADGLQDRMAGVFVGNLTAAGVLKALKAKAQTPSQIVQQVAREQAAQGTPYLLGFLSRGERLAFLKNPSRGTRFLGQAVHRATYKALEKLYPKRFVYRLKGPDFEYTPTGQLVELTTEGQVGCHAARYGPGVDIVTYPLP